MAKLNFTHGVLVGNTVGLSLTHQIYATLLYTPDWLSLTTVVSVILGVISVLIGSFAIIFSILFARQALFDQLFRSRIEDAVKAAKSADSKRPYSLEQAKWITIMNEQSDIADDYRKYLNALSNSRYHRFTHWTIRKLIPETREIQDRLNQRMRTETEWPESA